MIILVLIYLTVAHVFNLISITYGWYLVDKNLIANLLWPVALFQRFFLKK